MLSMVVDNSVELAASRDVLDKFAETGSSEFTVFTGEPFEFMLPMFLKDFEKYPFGVQFLVSVLEQCFLATWVEVEELDDDSYRITLGLKKAYAWTIEDWTTFTLYGIKVNGKILLDSGEEYSFKTNDYFSASIRYVE